MEAITPGECARPALRGDFRCAVVCRKASAWSAEETAVDENVRSSDGERRPIQLPHP
jgi:hypothetical protein